MVIGDEEGAAVQWGTKDQGGDGGAAAAAGSQSGCSADQRKKEVQDVAVVGSLVKVAYAEAWTSAWWMICALLPRQKRNIGSM